MFTENESLSFRSRSQRDEADTVLNCRGLKPDYENRGHPDYKHLCLLLIMGSTTLSDAFLRCIHSRPGDVMWPDSS